LPYDVHIVRTESWLDSADKPISKAEVDSLIAADPELEWSSSDWMDMADDKGKVTRNFGILWRREPCFWWYRDEVRCAGPSQEHIAKMVQMADQMNARVVGDDGEVYT
jgi:hypothetical protein